MSPISLVAGLVLITTADRLQGRITLGIFTLTAVTLFTCSALYHRVRWQEKYRALWRRIDHANIPILIAGTYTPFSVYLLNKNQAIILLACVWGGAILTALIRILWLALHVGSTFHFIPLLAGPRYFSYPPSGNPVAS